MNKGAKVVSSALLGFDARAVVINGKTYVIMPPTMERIAGAAYYLAGVEDCSTIEDLINLMKNAGDICRALSWFIKGDESLADELAKGTPAECADALAQAYALIDAVNFKRLSALAMNVARLIAKPL